MHKVRKILFPTDFSLTAQNAFRYALRLAEKWDASIQVLHVIFPQTVAIDYPVLAEQATQKMLEAAEETIISFTKNAMAQVQASHEFEQLPELKKNIEVGTVFDVINWTIDREEIDLVIMGTQGEHSQMDKFMGSVSSRVVRETDCPVLVVPELSDYRGINRLVYGTDLRDTDPFHIWETTQMLEPFNPIVRCVHVETSAKEKTKIKADDLEAFFRKRSPELQFTVHTIKNEAVATGLEEFAESYRADMLVMHKPKENWLHRMFFVSETKEMCFLSKIPLLVVR